VKGSKVLRLNLKKACTFYNIVLLLGLIARLLWIYLVQTKPVSDFEYYQRLATQIANGGQWGNTYTTVGYSIFLAFFYRLLGSSIWIAKMLNLVLSTLTNLLVLNIMKKIGIAEALLRLIFVLFVFFPMNIYYNSIVASEILFTTLLLLCSSIYLSDIKHRYVLIGVVTGLNTMIKPFFPLFALAVILSDLLSQKGFWKSIKKGLIILLIAGVTIVPWLYRNYLLIGEFTYVSNNGGIVLYINNNSQNNRGGWMPADKVENSLVNTSEYRSANLTERNKMLSRAAKAWIMSHPKEFVNLGIMRVKRTFDHFEDKNNGDIFFAFYGSSIPSAFQIKIFEAAEKIRAPIFRCGILSVLFYTVSYVYFIFTRRYELLKKEMGSAKLYRERGCILILLSFYMFAAVYFLTEGQSRYAFPTVFSLIFFAVLGIAEIGNIIKSSLIKIQEQIFR
jgi:4-amino-4-deoxy-L-arabinose transferase and related glycosyltransferases of PMT family